ncbi:MAG: hypothetical protein ABSG60_15955 [Terracidiphilus sp.]|jgi:FtsZ-binding cell division protein ZapB
MAETAKSTAEAKAESDLAKLDLEIKRIDLETKQLDLEEAKERNQRLKNEKADRSRKNRQRQAQLATDRANRKALMAECNHRQGGSPKNPYKGKGDSALSVFNMPDGFTKLIKCIICRGECWSPHPADQATAIREGETAAQRDARVAKYHADLAEFNRLYDLAKDKLSEEAAQEMQCGVTITTTNTETGAPVLRRRPCDRYAA